MRGRKVEDKYGYEWREPLTPLAPRRERAFDGFDDASNLLGPGVYVLLNQGEVVYVAWSKDVLESLSTHRSLLTKSIPSWFPIPPVRFDRFHFRRCASDIGETIVAELIAQFSPVHNRSPAHANPA